MRSKSVIYKGTTYKSLRALARAYNVKETVFKSRIAMG